MSAVNADSVSDLLMDAIRAVLATSKMGYAGYILLAICTVGLWYFRKWLKKQELIAAKRRSEEEANKSQAGNTTDNQNVSDKLNQAHDKIEDVRKENPDSGKKKREVDGNP